MYAWTLPLYEFKKDLDSGTFHKDFTTDLSLVLFQNARIASTSGEPAVPPFRGNVSSYHEADSLNDDCCIRPEFHGEGKKHRTDFVDRIKDLKARLSRAEARIKELGKGSSSVTPGTGKKRKLMHERDID